MNKSIVYYKMPTSIRQRIKWWVYGWMDGATLMSSKMNNLVYQSDTRWNLTSEIHETEMMEKAKYHIR